ncbi:MAG: hypothetical protein ACK5XN_23270, partial [Bacteroidota bacterium]
TVHFQIGSQTTITTTRITISPTNFERKINLYTNGISAFSLGVSENKFNMHIPTAADSFVFQCTGTNGDGLQLMKLDINGLTVGSIVSTGMIATSNYIAINTTQENESKMWLYDATSGLNPVGFGVSTGQQLNSFVPTAGKFNWYLNGNNANGTKIMTLDSAGLNVSNISCTTLTATNFNPTNINPTNLSVNSTSTRNRVNVSPTVYESKITLYDNLSTTNHYGFGTSLNQLNYHTMSTSDDHVFYSGGRNGFVSGTSTELFRIKGDKSVTAAGPLTAPSLISTGNVSALSGTVQTQSISCSSNANVNSLQVTNSIIITNGNITLQSTSAGIGIGKTITASY